MVCAAVHHQSEEIEEGNKKEQYTVSHTADTR